MENNEDIIDVDFNEKEPLNDETTDKQSIIINTGNNQSSENDSYYNETSYKSTVKVVKLNPIIAGLIFIALCVLGFLFAGVIAIIICVIFSIAILVFTTSTIINKFKK